MINSTWIALIPWASAAHAAHTGEYRFCGWLYGSHDPATMSWAHGTFAVHADVDPGQSPNAVLPNGDRVFLDDLASPEQKVEVAER